MCLIAENEAAALLVGKVENPDQRIIDRGNENRNDKCPACKYQRRDLPIACKVELRAGSNGAKGRLHISGVSSAAF